MFLSGCSIVMSLCSARIMARFVQKSACFLLPKFRASKSNIYSFALPILLSLITTGLLVASSSLVQAQSNFDSGSVLRQIERSLPVPTLPTVGPEEELPKVALLQGKGERLFLRSFVVSGNQLVDPAVLREAVAS